MSFDPKKFGDVVTVVAAEAEASDEAWTKRRTAEAELLEGVIEIAKPALKAVGTRPSVRYQFEGDRFDLYSERCVLLCNVDDPKDPQGDRDLFLRSDGTLICFTYSSESWGWEAKIKEYTNPLDAISDGWNRVDNYIQSLSAEIEQAMGQRTNRTKADRTRAEKLAAICTLLRK